MDRIKEQFEVYDEVRRVYWYELPGLGRLAISVDAVSSIEEADEKSRIIYRSFLRK